jgi:hypothetical protein
VNVVVASAAGQAGQQRASCRLSAGEWGRHSASGQSGRDEHASAAKPERVWSYTGWLVTKQRNTLSVDLAMAFIWDFTRQSFFNFDNVLKVVENEITAYNARKARRKGVSRGSEGSRGRGPQGRREAREKLNCLLPCQNQYCLLPCMDLSRTDLKPNALRDQTRGACCQQPPNWPEKTEKNLHKLLGLVLFVWLCRMRLGPSFFEAGFFRLVFFQLVHETAQLVWLG